ncbi:uncharacterized protein BJ171DRAFT_501184 [Polychytrium aggregatum]|uniref:uncharacterized protein n=1 Tax=Polychytrium aggregatum TaxID=110093 RepID=UPI0022FEF8C9|nr:uncharacterized protein BJ171DRAFT_501184 [Polychytrium aggregatum]KAI9205688.1 hypothetical protein BJ171DRAFT_501184 [Polychytrium aggregatum]
MVKLLSAFALVLASAVSTFAYPTGAGTCDADATTIHMGMGFTQSPSGFSLSASSGQYTPGSPITITVQGSGTFKGVLLYATLDDGTTRVGTWQIGSGFRSMPECTGSDPTAWLTHSTADIKNAGTTFTWNPPASVSGNIHFQGAIVPGMPNFDIFTSIVLTPAAAPAPASAPAGASSAASSGVAPIATSAGAPTSAASAALTTSATLPTASANSSSVQVSSKIFL